MSEPDPESKAMDARVLKMAKAVDKFAYDSEADMILADGRPFVSGEFFREWGEQILQNRQKKSR